MTGPSLAEVLDAHWAEPSERHCVDGKWIYARACDCGWIGPYGDYAEHLAAAVTAHLAAILGDPETVEAVAKVLCGIDPARAPYSDQIQQVVNEALDDARAAIAVIVGRIGCEVQA